MTLPDQQIISLLKEIAHNLKEPGYKELYSIIIGTVLGSILALLGQISMYWIQERKRKEEIFQKFIGNLYSLAEEMRHNACHIKIETYVLQYYSLQMEFMNAHGLYRGEYNGLLQRTTQVVDERLRQRELLSARLTGMIAEHNMNFGIKNNITEAITKFRNFDWKKQTFQEIKNLESLRLAYDPNFTETLNKEMENTYVKNLYYLVNLLVDSINEGRKKRFFNFYKREK
jgi:hypothetical protein